MRLSHSTTEDWLITNFSGDVGEQGDKGSIGKAIDGPPGDQGYQGTVYN